MTECEIISVDNDKSKLLPKIVTFQNGQLHSSNENQLQCALFSDKKTKKNILAVATERFVYTGEENSNDELFYTLLAIRNTKTNKIRLVPVNTVSLNVHLSKVNTLLDTTLSSNSLGIRDLYKQFGSKKAKKQTEQIEKMKMNVTSVEEELKDAVKDITLKEEDLNMSVRDEIVEDYRPFKNRNATEVESVYDLKSMLQQGHLDSLEELATQVINEHTIEEQLSPFVLDCINKLKNNGVKDVEKYEILLYIDAVLKFFKKPLRDIYKKVASIPPYPQIIFDKVFQDYTVLSDGNRLRPLTMRDKAASYIIVLSLIALSYKVNLTTLSTSITMGIKKLLDISRTVGAQPLISAKEKNLIVLKLPLAVPPMSVMKRKRN